MIIILDFQNIYSYYLGMIKRTFTVLLILLSLVSASVFAGNGILSSFSATDLDGKQIDESYLKAKDLTLVFVWGTYCGYCRQEMPTLEKLSAEYENFQILGVVTDLLDKKGNVSASQLAKANQIIKQTGMSAPSLLPNESLAKMLKNAYALPYAIFVDKDGNQMGIGRYGMQTEAALKKDIERFLK